MVAVLLGDAAGVLRVVHCRVSGDGGIRQASPRLPPRCPAPRRSALIWERLGYVGDSRLAAAETGGRVVLLLSEIFREAAVLLSRRFRLPAYVRFWL